MSEACSLFDHAVQLHQRSPDVPLPHEGMPYPDAAAHPPNRRLQPDDQRRQGADVAVVLDAYFADSASTPSELVQAFHDVAVPIHHNEHIAAAALRADRHRVQQTGRWLVRHSTDQCSVIVGLALLATDWAAEDVPLIKTIGLLSKTFGPLAARALRRRDGGAEALVWLAERSSGWGRVYVIEALCEVAAPKSREWLLRNACDGDFLNAYFAGEVATAAYLHEAITRADADDALVDHTGRLLNTMTFSSGMGTRLDHYPSTARVLEAHAGHLGRQAPSVRRYIDAARIADYLARPSPAQPLGTIDRPDLVVRQYTTVLDRPDWCAAARAGFAGDGDFPHRDYRSWFVENTARRLKLKAFA